MVSRARDVPSRSRLTSQFCWKSPKKRPFVLGVILLLQRFVKKILKENFLQCNSFGRSFSFRGVPLYFQHVLILRRPFCLTFGYIHIRAFNESQQVLWMKRISWLTVLMFNLFCFRINSPMVTRKYHLRFLRDKCIRFDTKIYRDVVYPWI